jgi:hypothetical protein
VSEAQMGFVRQAGAISSMVPERHGLSGPLDGEERKRAHERSTCMCVSVCLSEGVCVRM